MTDGDRPSSFERPEAMIILNPAAHNVPARRQLVEVDEWLKEHGWTADWRETHGPGEAAGIAAGAADRQVPLVIACGGDGTVNEVANGLALSETALGTIPAGTSNIWAREIGLPRRPVETIQALVNGDRRRIDLGRAGERYFVLFAGFGIDAAVTATVPLGIKSKIGAAAYAISAARQALAYRPTPMTVRIDGVERKLDVLEAFAGNTRLYAGITKIASAALADDGKLDFCIYVGRGKPDILMHAARTLFQVHRKSDKVLYRRATRLEFDTDTPLPAQLDGDPVDPPPREVHVVPSALWVATPAAFTGPMLSRPAEQPGRAEPSLPQRQTG
jgi:YegS/Rv2252/BmrU family lipid kinase